MFLLTRLPSAGQRNETWAALVADAESRGVLLATPRPYRPFLDRHCSTGAADGPQGTLEPRGALRKQQAPRAREQSLPGSTDAFERDKGENTHRRETIRGTESKKAETERKVTRDSGEAAAPRDSGALQGPKARRQASRVDERGTPEQGTSNALKAVRSSSGLPSEGGVERATDAIDWVRCPPSLLCSILLPLALTRLFFLSLFLLPTPSLPDGAIAVQLLLSFT